MTGPGEGNELTLHLVQDRGLLGTRGVTGSVTWDSSIALSRLLYGQPEFLPERARPKGRQVVELGSGCGLVGMTCAALGARRVVCTDREDMIPHLERNIRANAVVIASDAPERPFGTKGGQSGRKGKGKRKGKSLDEEAGATSTDTPDREIMTAELEWGRGLGRDGGRTRGDPLTQLFTNDPPDLLIASDCVYNECVTPLLVSTLVDLSGPETTLVVAQELRSDLVHLGFLEALMESFTLDRLYPTEGGDGMRMVIPDVSADVPVVIYMGHLRSDLVDDDE
ncbi:hypothetical protein BJ684DRAFT_20988 [Piptocephalis cylindrospora]|uniref:Methyltransferase-domain-containing protein n=1 Tax=Piptocephalis cylindrospora TaxID=1907219 RepID=A0A4P9Y146_9FUNG|nr:hypothetical protein BJ684DRAFT_20988 [Piptocephalis cylindrospora]|eukprot:RKP12473.1 hypothetical protein BJ684DRAFT_20988 [Piptocephalis cylindrospora]